MSISVERWGGPGLQAPASIGVPAQVGPRALQGCLCCLVAASLMWLLVINFKLIEMIQGRVL